MKCKFDKTLISFYLDGELEEEKAREVELHLKECEACREKLSELKQANSIIDRLETVEVSGDYDRKFQERFEKVTSKEETSKTTPWEKKKLWDEVKGILSGSSTAAKATVAAALVLIVSFTLFALRPGSSPTIITAKGNIQEYNKQAHSWEKVKSGETVEEGDVIKTAQNSFADIELKGVYKLRIKPDAKVSINKAVRNREKGITQYEIKKGNMLVKIEKKMKDSKFQVKTPTGIVQAKGTAFMVNQDVKDKKTLLSVAEGTVLAKVDSRKQLVNKDKKILLTSSGIAKGPTPVSEEDKEKMKEIKEIGKIIVELGINDTIDRTKQLLKPARLYAYGKYPQEVGRLLDRGLLLVIRANKTDSKELHLSSIKQFKRIVEKYPAKRYNAQIMLFVGAYYKYLEKYQKAIDMFKKVAQKYPDTQWASIATLAQGIIFEEKVGNVDKASKLYEKILSEYSRTLEAKFVKKKENLLTK